MGEIKIRFLIFNDNIPCFTGNKPVSNPFIISPELDSIISFKINGKLVTAIKNSVFFIIESNDLLIDDFLFGGEYCTVKEEEEVFTFLLFLF